MNNVCIICDERMTISKVVNCPYCDFTTCRTCVRKYVLNETEPKCMNCKKVWTRAHQNTVLKPSFVNKELREHLERVYYEHEMALFPATIEVIEDRRLTTKLSREFRILQEQIHSMSAKLRYLDIIVKENNRILELSKKSPVMYSDYKAEELQRQTDEVTLQYKTQKREIHEHRAHLNAIHTLILMAPEERKVVMSNYIDGANPEEILQTLQQMGSFEDAVRRSKTCFVRACPIESCRGFLSKQWKCGICGIFTCSKCNIPILPKNLQGSLFGESSNTSICESDVLPNTNEEETDHICNPDDIATAELLAKDTKPCPKCGTGIFKIDGCDQMWCTECRTAFNWRTGSLEIGHVHNPHYFEYQRRMGADVRNIMDIPCGGLEPNAFHGVIHHLIVNVTSTMSRNQTEREKLGLSPLSIEVARQLLKDSSNYTMSIQYYAAYLLPRYRPDAIQNNLELRVLYLTKEITEEEFKSALSREAKQFNKRIEIGQVIQTVIFGMGDILTRLIQFMRNTDDQTNTVNYCDIAEIIKFFREIDSLIEYANECLEYICKQYKLTRVAMIIRNNPDGCQPGLYTVREMEGNTPEGKRKYLQPVRNMY